MSSRFSDFFSRAQPSEDYSVSPGRVAPVSSKSPPSPARVDITDPQPIRSPRHRRADRQNRQFAAFLSTSIVDLDKIKEISWMGIPEKMRARVWRLFLDYEPISSDIADATLEHKRKDYFDCLDRLFSAAQQQLWTSSQKQTLRQISIDLPRTPLELLRNERVNLLFQHVLFVWAVRHPASGYVQGMNDILLPFFFVFVAERLGEALETVAARRDVDCLSDEVLSEVEADCFWCFGKLLDGIQDVFTKDQPGLYRMIDALDEVIRKVEPTLAEWMARENIRLCNFAVRWMNCLLVREFPMAMLFRVWDLFMSDHSKIAPMQVYVCAAMMHVLAPELIELPEPEFVMKIQSLTPTYWTQEKVETILAQSFVYEKTVPFSPMRFRQ